MYKSAKHTLASGKPSWKYVGSHDSSTKKQLFWQACAVTIAQNDGRRTANKQKKT